MDDLHLSLGVAIGQHQPQLVQALVEALSASSLPLSKLSAEKIDTKLYIYTSTYVLFSYSRTAFFKEMMEFLILFKIKTLKGTEPRYS